MDSAEQKVVDTPGRPMGAANAATRGGNRRGRRSRAEILAAASRLMAENGYAATTLMRVSEETGLPKSTIYHHFRSKGGLLCAVMEQGAYEFFGAMREAQATPPDALPARELLRWYLRSTGEVFLARPDFLRLHFALLMSAEAQDAEVGPIIERVRRDGRGHMNTMIAKSFSACGTERAQLVADRLDHFAIAGFDGAFIAWRADPAHSITDAMDLLADAIVGLAERVIAEQS